MRSQVWKGERVEPYLRFVVKKKIKIDKLLYFYAYRAAMSCSSQQNLHHMTQLRTLSSHLN